MRSNPTPAAAARSVALRAALALPLLLGGLAPALAQEPDAAREDRRPGGRPGTDTVVLELSAEDFVRTETAEVVVVAEAAATGADTGKARADLLAAVRGLAPEGDWRLVRFAPSTDSAGLERWYAEAQARLPEGSLGGLAERARGASRPGLQLRVDRIEFMPTLAEVEAAKARLRAEVYRRAREEAETLNRVYQGRAFRIGSIGFVEGDGAPRPKPMMRAAPTAEMAAAPEPLPVGDRLRLDARVVLRAEAPGR
jgi:hypothetical protein